MRKLLYPLLIVVAVAAFWLAWPAWSAYQIRAALEAKDAEALERKIDFARVRASLRNAAADKLAQVYVPPQTGPSNPVLVERLKQEAVSRMLDGTLANLVTPGSLILLASEGGSLKESIERMLRDQMSRGGQSAPAAGAAAGGGKRGPVFRTIGSSEAQQAPPPAYGLANIKHVAIGGPLSWEIGLAKHAAAPAAEVLVELGFTGTDWKVTAVRPAP
jgi:Protein of unknown function (DUF2939)